MKDTRNTISLTNNDYRLSQLIQNLQIYYQTRLQNLDQLILQEIDVEVAVLKQVSGYIFKFSGKRIRVLLMFMIFDAIINLLHQMPIEQDLSQSAEINLALHGDSDQIIKSQEWQQPVQDLINLAMIVEFIHNATILHDDVVDDNITTRRGLSTANNLWQNKLCILGGDFLLAKAFKNIIQTGQQKIAQILSSAACKIIQGEVNQIVYNTSPENLTKHKDSSNTNLENNNQRHKCLSDEVINASLSGTKMGQDEDRDKAINQFTWQNALRNVFKKSYPSLDLTSQLAQTNLSILQNSLQEYLMMIEQKTAVLFEAAVQISALTSLRTSSSLNAELSEQLASMAAQFANYLGIAFQMRDDLLDYCGNENSLGKALGADYFEDKMTLPIILYRAALIMDSANQEKIKLFEQIWQNKTKQNFTELVNLIKLAKIHQQAWLFIDQYIAQARQILQQIVQKISWQMQIHAAGNQTVSKQSSRQQIGQGENSEAKVALEMLSRKVCSTQKKFANNLEVLIGQVTRDNLVISQVQQNSFALENLFLMMEALFGNALLEEISHI